MLGLPDELTLDEFAFELAGVSFDYVAADGSGFDALAGTDVGFALMGTTVVGADLLGTFEGEAVVVGTGVGHISSDNDIVGADMDLADASFEASAFDEGGAFALPSFRPRVFASVEPVLFDEAFFGEVDGDNCGFMGDAGDGTVDVVTDADEVFEIGLHGV